MVPISSLTHKHSFLPYEKESICYSHFFLKSSVEFFNTPKSEKTNGRLLHHRPAGRAKLFFKCWQHSLNRHINQKLKQCEKTNLLGLCVCFQVTFGNLRKTSLSLNFFFFSRLCHDPIQLSLVCSVYGGRPTWWKLNHMREDINELNVMVWFLFLKRNLINQTIDPISLTIEPISEAFVCLRLLASAFGKIFYIIRWKVNHDKKNVQTPFFTKKQDWRTKNMIKVLSQFIELNFIFGENVQTLVIKSILFPKRKFAGEKSKSKKSFAWWSSWAQFWNKMDFGVWGDNCFRDYVFGCCMQRKKFDRFQDTKEEPTR